MLIDIAKVNCKRLILQATLTCLALLSLLANANKPGFKTVFNESAPGEIKVIFQDQKGYLWFGARNALLRYDAYTFKYIHYLEETEQGKKEKAPYFVKSIIQDRDNTIWVASDNGIFRFNADLGILERPKESSALPINQPVQDIAELPSGRLMVGSHSGLTILNLPDLDGFQLTHDPEYPNSIADNSVIKILVDSRQRVWVSTNSGLHLFDENNSTAELFIPDPENPKIVAHNQLSSLVEHPSGLILGGTASYGMYVFDPSNKRFSHYLNDPQDPDSIPANDVHDILVDSEGTTWVAGSRTAFSHFDVESRKFKTFPYVAGEASTPESPNGESVFEDRNGDIWMGFYPTGISFHDRSTTAISVYKNNYNYRDYTIYNDNVQAVMEDSQGNLWVAVGNAVDRFDRETGKFTHYTHESGNYPAHGTLSGYVDSKDRVWIGTWQGGYSLYDANTDRFVAQPVNPDLSNSPETQSATLNDSTIWAFCETQDESIWIGTHSAGISHYDEQTGLFTRYKNSGGNPGSLVNNIAWSCLEDSKGRFWIGTAGGLSRMQEEKGTFKNYVVQEHLANGLQGPSIMDIFEDSKNRVWFGTNRGLHLYREATDDFEVFTKEDGFVDEGIRGIASDPEGNLWLGTNNGIVRFNPETKAVRNFTEYNGEKFGGINTGAATSNERGEVIFGSISGLILIDTTKLTINKVPPPVVLTDFKIFTRSVPVNGPDQILSKNIEETESLTLDYTKNMFSFEFSALNFRNPEKNRFAYKLEGFDNEWRHVGSSRKAQYTNLSAGNYVFRVRASNNDGIWNETGKSVKIRQLPPPWLTWWAYTLYTLAVISLIINFVRSQQKKRRIVEEQNRILEIKVAERTADLAAKNKDIQSMLTNMRQGLFTIEGNGSIHHEYSKNLESIFETDTISGRKAIDFLFENSQVGTDMHSQIETSFASIIGLHEMNFDFNYHLLLKEYTIHVNGKDKILSLDWSPITENHETSKLMVSVRDISELKELQIEAAGKRQELALVSELIGIDGESFLEFNRSTNKYLQQNRELIEAHCTYDENAAKQLFRNMHTIKGNSRTHGFSSISNAAHEAESIYSQLKSDCTLWQQENLLADLSAVEQSLHEYNKVYEEVLGKPLTASNQGVVVDSKDLNEIQQGIGEIQSTFPVLYQQILNLLYKAFSNTVKDSLSHQIHSLPSIAEELGKAAPKLTIEDNGIRVKKESQNLLQDVFSHVLRNSIDHGIETPAEREHLGKPAKGNIAIKLEQNGDDIDIRVKDDGSGLNLEKLFLKGLERDKWSVKNPPKISDIAELVFESEISTKEQVTDISGRGVGMDAVKAFLHEAGGYIRLQTKLDDKLYEPGSSPKYAAFETCITLPKHHFIVI